MVPIFSYQTRYVIQAEPIFVPLDTFLIEMRGRDLSYLEAELGTLNLGTPIGHGLALCNLKE